MSEININVSESELRIFADYISNFAKYIDGDCAELQAAMNSLAATMDEDSASDIVSMVNEISNILSNQTPALHNLESKVTNYADFVARLKAAAGN